MKTYLKQTKYQQEITPNNNVFNTAIGIYPSGIYSRDSFLKAIYF